MPKRGVSEVLGYLLVLSIIVATVTVIYAAGVPAIRSQEEIAVFRSMENTFFVLQSVERLVAFGTIPEKLVQIRAEEGSIAVIPNFGWINVSVAYNNGTQIASFLPLNMSCGAIVYQHRSGRAIMLFDDAVIYYYGRDSAVLVSGPRAEGIVDSGDGLNIYMGVINVSGVKSFAGYGTLDLKSVSSSIYTKSLNLGRPNKPVTICISVNVRDILGINGTLIRDEILRYLNQHLFNGRGVIFGGNLIVRVKRSGHPPYVLNFNYLNLTIAWYNVSVS